ncbi:MAG: leucine--tRNA ligase [Bacteroidetes bacterium]|nr:leucine--tRNA ligase [Bacteroidota bacterium]MDA1223596.1 leucine--tRNA ligase [Bacteroidota bacterium]
MSAQYTFTEIEKKWQAEWEKSRLYSIQIDPTKPKYYALDMFPYPSGSGLHVGHPLGYIASDIVSRYKRLKGFNVLHPMGYDAFGLPAEQYAIQTGQHPSVTTEQNIKRFREQLNIMGFSYDWDRQVKTCDPNYYQFTQWIFSLFFNHWYNKSAQKAEPLSTLEAYFSANGSADHNAHGGKISEFSAQDWQGFSPVQKHNILNQFRLAFIDETTVNWCEAMGTVLANEEVINGLSERGGYPVIRKKMKQWSLRITAYADRLIEGLESIQWSDAIKEIQKNWIGRSQGAEIDFVVRGTLKTLKVFTTRPDTIFGATFMVVAPELENLKEFCSDAQWPLVQEYSNKAKNRSEIDRMADTTKTGVFTGLEAINPFTGEPIPIWVSDYVLANYGTGVIMAVPAHDDRDFAFAKAFNLSIIPVIKPAHTELELPLTESFSAKEGICFNSGFLDGLPVKEAIQAAIKKIEKAGWGQAKVNYKLREAGFGRQRYWGEPFPITYNNEGIPQLENHLPVELPQVESYKPSGNGESPLSAVTDWVNTPQGNRETDTMPGWAGSSWYFLRYTDPNSTEVFASKEALQYWQQVDLYVGGSEHATGHLLYSRFWTKFLFDLDYISWDEPFQRLVNQGMIMGEDGQKMSKRWGNVVNPDDVCAQYGADTLRMYEMFLGPLTDSKPWNTNGIEGVSRFFGKFWRLFYDGENWAVSTEKASNEELKILHKTIKKVTEDIESMSFNTSVSAFMVATNELGTLKCRKREILEPILILLAPFAPHIAEELWHQLGNKESIHIANWPQYDASFLVENSFNYPISINGKTRAQMEFELTASEDEIKQAVLNHDTVIKWMEGKPLKKFILVKGRIVNVVV